jgi:nucleoporin GLE1
MSFTASAFSFSAPSQPHRDEIHTPFLSSLAKAILLQAETEVIASKTAVVPLATVTKILLGTLSHFEDVLWAKLVRRIRGWAVDSSNYDQLFNETSLWIVTRYRDVPAPLDERSGKQITEQRESQAEYITRVSGIMNSWF